MRGHVPAWEIWHAIRISVAMFAAGFLIEVGEEMGVDVDLWGHVGSHGSGKEKNVKKHNNNMSRRKA